MTSIEAPAPLPHLGETGTAKLPPSSQPDARAAVLAKIKQQWAEPVTHGVTSFLSFLPERFLSGTNLPPFHVEIVADPDPDQSPAWYTKGKDGKGDVFTINTSHLKYQWQTYYKDKFPQIAQRSEAMERVKLAILTSIYHEGMHWLHLNAGPEYQKLIADHFESRTKGNDPEDLPGDKKGRKYRKDNFPRDYMGLVQEGRPPGHEIPTCVGELLADPKQLAKYLRDLKQRDTIILVLSILFQ